MTEQYDQAFANQIAVDCQDILELSNIIVACMRGDQFISWRFIEKGQITKLIEYVMEEKTEEDQVLVWSVSQLCQPDNWALKYPAGMKAWYKKGRESVMHRRTADFAGLTDGFTLKTRERCGYLYYREDARMLEMYVEVSGVAKYDFLLSWDGLDRWVYPQDVAVAEDQRTELSVRVQKWLNDHGYRTKPPD